MRSLKFSTKALGIILLTLFVNRNSRIVCASSDAEHEGEIEDLQSLGLSLDLGQDERVVNESFGSPYYKAKIKNYESIFQRDWERQNLDLPERSPAHRWVNYL